MKTDIATIKLTADLATRFGKLRARVKELQEEEKQLADDIKEAMNAAGVEVYEPSASPYKLAVSTYERTDISWKDECLRLLREFFGAKKAMREFVHIQETADKKEVTSLLCTPNPHYKPQ